MVTCTVHCGSSNNDLKVNALINYETQMSTCKINTTTGQLLRDKNSRKHKSCKLQLLD